MMKTVADIMTSMPIVATVPGSRNDAINLMVRNKLTGVPVVRESDGQLMGIVSRRDVFNNMKEEQLSMLMKKNPITITPDKSIAEAAKIFYDLRIHRLPVVDKGRLVGIVTPTDLLREIRTMKTKKTAIDSIRAACVTCYKDDPLSYVVAAMKISGVTAMPVLNERGIIIGLITDRDLFSDQTMDVNDMKKRRFRWLAQPSMKCSSKAIPKNNGENHVMNSHRLSSLVYQ